MIGFVESPSTPDEHFEEPEEILSDDSIVQNSEWRFLKLTLDHPTFDLKKFKVRFYICKANF